MPSQLQLPTDVPRLVTYPWHPKLTVSRLLVISSTVGLGIAKATAAYRGETIAPVTIEWITTTLVFLIYLVLSVVELNHRPRPAWLFQRDTLDIVWMFARKLSFRPPVYETRETTAELLVTPRHPPITLYRLLVTFTALRFGLLKAAFSYLGKTTEPTTLDWLLGVVVTTGLYYLGLYERSSRHVLSSIFEQDYREEFLHAGSFVVWTANYTMGLLLSFGWIYLWSLTFYEGILGAGLVAVFVFTSLLGRLAITASLFLDRSSQQFAAASR
ncbi:hypothetical protein BKA70DRAFT_356835 [Coprinopsis sp. MPI-PUGE-AT-0042]|nr:hypothetical protein BKA70DRAFT_356835 [Coprinopsis sp. MPI-PUGE-AT-0042]